MKKERCQHCGSVLMKHRHGFTAPLATILLKIAATTDVGQPFHPIKDISLSHCAVANMQKLQYWGMIVKARDRDGVRLGGYWQLTEKAARAILNGDFPRWVVTFNNEVVEESGDTMTIHDAVGGYDLPEHWARRAMPAFPAEDKQMGLPGVTG